MKFAWNVEVFSQIITIFRIVNMYDVVMSVNLVMFFCGWIQVILPYSSVRNSSWTVQ